ncbi:MAG: double zinc ribbon domain-containing protein [Planctomycetota bacterium]
MLSFALPTPPLVRRARKRIHDAASRGVSLLLPESCVACGGELPLAATDTPSPGPFCEPCAGDLQLFGGDCCERCGAPLVSVSSNSSEAATTLPCGSCRDQRWRFDEAIAAGEYGGLLRSLTLRAKDASEEAVALSLGELMWRRSAERLREIAPDAVASVPMHWRRRLARRTNAPELMAEVIADRLGVPFAPRLIERVRATRRQPTLARSQRLPNVRAAFRAGWGHQLKAARIVLVDDILTTGATCSEAARSLKRAGAAQVVVVVAARSL